MMVPVGRLTVMKIVPRDQYMAAMTFVTLPGEVGPLLGPALGGVLVEYASALDLPHQYPGGDRRRNRHPLSDAQLHHADPALRSLRLSAAGRRNGDPDHGARRPERARHFPAWLAGLVAVGLCALLLYLWHARGNARALFSLNLFRNRTFSLGLGGSFAGRIGSGMLPFMTPVFLQIGLGFSPFTPG